MEQVALVDRLEPECVARLAERREDALLYKRLATLAEDAPISRNLAELEWKGVPRGAFEDFCAEMGSERLLTRPRRWASCAPG